MLKVEGQFHHYEPPYVPDFPGAPILLIFPNSPIIDGQPGLFELVSQPTPTEGEQAIAWPGMAGDSARLYLGAKIRCMQGSQAEETFTLKMYRGALSWIPDRWAQYYT